MHVSFQVFDRPFFAYDRAMPQDCEKNRLVRFDLAQETVRDALEWDGSRPYGPATTLRQYIRQLAWHLSIDGWITGLDYLKFNILHDSCGRICTLAKVMWSHPIISLVDRKGFGDFVPDLAVFHRVFHGLTEEAQHLVKLNIVGAFQTVARKAKWDESITDECELCGQTDTREHRLLHCHLLQDVRQNAQEACSVLQNERAAWIYLPMPRVHDQLTVFRAFVRSVKPPEVQAPRNCDLTFLRFFTDGAAQYRRHSCARITT